MKHPSEENKAVAHHFGLISEERNEVDQGVIGTIIINTSMQAKAKLNRGDSIYITQSKS